jgi:AcrR family transcriptional regulator
LTTQRISRKARETPKVDPSRERVIKGAIEVFGALGYSKSTVQDITAAARVSKPIFYRHFENKSDVFEVVVDRVCSEWYDAILEKTREFEGRTVESLRALLLETLAHTQARPLLQRLLTRDAQLVLWSESNVLDQIHTRVRDLIQSVLEEGIASGQVRSDVPVAHLADAVNELVTVYAIRLVLGATIDDALAESVASFIAYGVEPRPDRDPS